jgi:hypothetical protein
MQKRISKQFDAFRSSREWCVRTSTTGTDMQHVYGPLAIEALNIRNTASLAGLREKAGY